MQTQIMLSSPLLRYEGIQASLPDVWLPLAAVAAIVLILVLSASYGPRPQVIVVESIPYDRDGGGCLVAFLIAMLALAFLVAMSGTILANP